MMKNSKAIAGESGRLIVGIVSDEAVIEQKGRAPILSFTERLELAQAIKYVDVVVEQTEYSPLTNIKMLKPTVLMESESHDPIQIKENEEVMRSFGGRLITMPYFKGQSSTMIKHAIYDTK
jgi:bifunctional ADP-heptose synthase (sugar kinase/adenylyltransferase)